MSDPIQIDPTERDIDETVELYFRQLFEAGWVGVESLLTKDQIEQSVTRGFIEGVFVATAIACIEDDHLSERAEIIERKHVLYRRYGSLHGVIGELIRRMDFSWLYVPINQRTQADWDTPDLTKIGIGCYLH